MHACAHARITRNPTPSFNPSFNPSSANQPTNQRASQSQPKEPASRSNPVTLATRNTAFRYTSTTILDGTYSTPLYLCTYK